MIKFFRKIRQNLLMENKTGKYFKYAIGEIVLVVIGILIALSINNLNEHYKQIKLKNEYVVSLSNDLTNDTIQLNNRLILNKQMLKNIDTIAKEVNNANIKNASDLYKLIAEKYNAQGGIRTINTYNNNSFNLLIASGNIDLFDKQLRQDIMELNRLQIFQKEVAKSNSEYFLRFMERISVKYPEIEFSSDINGLDKLLWEGTKIDEYPRDVIAYLSQKNYTIQRYIELTENVLMQTEKVLTQLKNQD